MFNFLYFCSIYNWILLLNLWLADSEGFKIQDLFLFVGIAFLIYLITFKKVNNYIEKKDRGLSKEEELKKDEKSYFVNVP